MSCKHELPEMNRLKNLLPMLLTIVFALQPLMDILSYWMGTYGMSNTITLVLRLAVLAFVALVGFAVSDRKKLYFIAAAVLVGIFAGHVVACSTVGYVNFISDVTNYIRVIQMPLFVICFISFISANEKCFCALENGLILNFWIITASVVISVVTGTYNPTYQLSGLGILGWFATSNAQSAIMSLLTPIVLSLSVYRKKKLWVFAITAVAAFAQLFFIGTRLAFFAMAVSVCGIILIMLITKHFSLRHTAVLVVCFALCCVCVKQSPMYLNQTTYLTSMASKQYDANIMIQQQKEQFDEAQPTEPQPTEPQPTEPQPTEPQPTEPQPAEVEVDEAERELAALRYIYNIYSANLSSRFGVDAVMEKYGYTRTISEITATRPQKIAFCSMLMDEHPFISRIFGLELDRMIYNDHNYDVENDFHGIYFLYGAAGLVLMLAFIVYFIILILKVLIKDFKKYFNMQSGAYGMALCLSLIYAYCTAGVLRRPNSSFYFSAVLAAVYYLVKLKKDCDISGGKERMEA